MIDWKAFEYARQIGMRRLSVTTDMDYNGVCHATAVRLPAPGTKLSLLGGKGRDDDEAINKSIYELIERASGEGLGKTSISTESYLTPSIRNYFQERNSNLSDDLLVDCIQAQCLSTRKSVFLPNVLFFDPYRDELLGIEGNSNGMACGQTIDSALISGILELIERDCMSILEHTGCGVRINLESLENEYINTIQEMSNKNDITLSIFDISYYEGLYTVYALTDDIHEGSSIYINGGVSCSFSFIEAAVNAIEEAFLSRSCMFIAAREDIGNMYSIKKNIERNKTIYHHKHLFYSEDMDIVGNMENLVSDKLEYIRNLLISMSHSVYWVDITMPNSPVYAVSVWSPSLSFTCQERQIREERMNRIAQCVRENGILQSQDIKSLL